MQALFSCKNCLNSMAIIEYAGEAGYCINCHTRYIFHHCQINGYGLQDLTRQDWLPALKPYISEACPACGIAINIGEQLEASSNVQLKSFGTGLVMIGMVFGVAVFLDHLFQR